MRRTVSRGACRWHIFQSPGFKSPPQFFQLRGCAHLCLCALKLSSKSLISIICFCLYRYSVEHSSLWLSVVVCLSLAWEMRMECKRWRTMYFSHFFHEIFNWARGPSSKTKLKIQYHLLPSLNPYSPFSKSQNLTFVHARSSVLNRSQGREFLNCVFCSPATCIAPPHTHARTPQTSHKPAQFALQHTARTSKQRATLKTAQLLGLRTQHIHVTSTQTSCLPNGATSRSFGVCGCACR